MSGQTDSQGGCRLHFRSADLAKVTLHAVASLVIAGPLNWISTSRAADLPPGDGYAYVSPVAQSGWEFRVTPYAWAPSVNGDVTVRGQTADIDMSFWDLFDSGNSGAELDSLAALMGYVEARNGRWGIYGDIVWGKFDFSGDAVKQRNPIANLNVSARANAGLDYEITMAESGLTYEVARWAGTSSATALDLLGGARYWNQELDLSLAVDASVDLGKLGLERSGSRAVARSGTLDWVDRSLDCACGINSRQEGSSNSWRHWRLWCRQRFNVAVICRLRLRLLAVEPSRRHWLSRPGGRL